MSDFVNVTRSNNDIISTYSNNQNDEGADEGISALATQLAEIASNVKSFGAKGDGVTDDTTAIQKALDQGGNIYFPSGTYIVNRPDSSTDYMLALSRDVNLLSEGNATIQVGNKGNQYIAIIGAYVADLTLRVDRLKFDANGSQNPMTPYSGETRTTALPHWRMNGMWLQIGSLYMTNCEFKDFYGTQTVMYSQNPNNYRDSYVQVHQCKFLSIGAEYGQSIHDHSTLYVHKDWGTPKTQALYISVTHNEFTANPTSAPNATNAFEMGSEVCEFTHNTIIGYRNGCAAAPFSYNTKAYYNNNTFINVGTGITPWANAYPSGFDSTKYKYDELIIRNNNIKVTPANFKNVQSNASLTLNADGVYPDYYAGIRFYTTAEQKMKTLVIENNFIEFVHDSSMPASGYQNGIGNGFDISALFGSRATFTIDELFIKHNTFKNISKLPIHIDMNGIQRMYIKENEFINVCLTPSRDQVIYINQDHLTLTEILRISKNTIRSGDYSQVYYIKSANSGTGSYYGTLYIEGNEVNPSTNLITQYIYYLAQFNDFVLDDTIMDVLKSVYLNLRYTTPPRGSFNLKFSSGSKLINNLIQHYRNTYPTVDDGYQYFVGDQIINTNPAASGYMGWACTTAGNPGTWKGYGAIQA